MTPFLRKRRSATNLLAGDAVEKRLLVVGRVVDATFGQLGQLSVGFLLFLLGLAQNVGRLGLAQFHGVAHNGAVTSNFVMLSTLGAGNQTGILGFGGSVLVDHFLTLGDNALHSLTGVTFGLHTQGFQYLLYTLEMNLGLLEMLFKSGLELGVVSRSSQLRQSLRELGFCRVEVLELLNVQVFQVIQLRHNASLNVLHRQCDCCLSGQLAETVNRGWLPAHHELESLC